MTITGKHYHLSTGKSSKNKGGFYLCQNKRTKAEEGCCIYPAYRDKDAHCLIMDTRHDLVLFGLLRNNDKDGKTLEEEKEVVESFHYCDDD